jgi:hypothetical protein
MNRTVAALLIVGGILVINLVAVQRPSAEAARACEEHALPWMQVSAEYAECLRQQEQDASGE